MLVFISDTIYMVSEHVQRNRSPLSPRTRVGSLDGLLARPATAPPGLLPHHHLPLAGSGFGRIVPAPGSGGRHQSGACLGAFRGQLLLPAALLPFPRPASGGVDPALAADSPAPVPATSGAGQWPRRRAGR